MPKRVKFEPFYIQNEEPVFLAMSQKEENLTESEKKTLYFVQYNADKELSVDITVDLLTYLVGYKLIYDQRRNTRKGKKIPLLYKLAGAILVISVAIGGLIFYFSGKTATNEAYKTVNNTNIFGSVNYFGKENVMETMVGRITRMIALIERKDQKLLGSKITAAKKNFLFYGEPGTGKTHFVKKYAYLLDQNLKLMEMRKKNIDISGLDRSELLKKMAKMKPQVRLISIQPSSLNDKYVGGTEKNIHRLWEHAKSSKSHAVTIIFMDEIDAFFTKRKEDNSEHSTNVKSEFLCILDGVRSALSDRVVFIGATNLPESLDEAFLRRFHTKICFKKPTAQERRQLIESFMIYNEVRLTESELQKIVDASADLSQSQIARIFSDAADLSDELTYSADCDDLAILLQNISAAGNNIEAELAEINVTMRGTEAGYVYLNSFVQ